jgi:hypothetical protein
MDEPIELARHRLARAARAQQGAFRGAMRLGVAAIRMDRVMAVAPVQVAGVRVAERRGGSWVRHPDEPVTIQDPDRLRDGGQRGGEYRRARQLPAVSIGDLA